VIRSGQSRLRSRIFRLRGCLPCFYGRAVSKSGICRLDTLPPWGFQCTVVTDGPMNMGSPANGFPKADPKDITELLVGAFLPMKIGFPFALTRNFTHQLLLIVALSTLRVEAIERWEVLPPTPKPIRSAHSGQANANGISIYYAVYGQGSPVILLHGGLANADYWGNQVRRWSRTIRSS